MLNHLQFFSPNSLLDGERKSQRRGEKTECCSVSSVRVSIGAPCKARACARDLACGASMAGGEEGHPWTAGGGKRCADALKTHGQKPRESDPDTRFYFKQLKGHQSFTNDKKTKTLSRSCQHPRQKAPNTLVLLPTTATGKGDARGSTDTTDCSHTPAAQNPDNRAQLQVNVTQTVLPANHGQALLALRCVAASHPDPACPRVSVALSPSYSGTSWLNTFQREVKLLINTFTLQRMSRHQVSHLRNTWIIKTIKRAVAYQTPLGTADLDHSI